MADLLPFEEVYARHAPDVYRFCLSQLHDEATAEDIAGDVFLSALAAYERTAPSSATVRIWLIRIAHNAIVSHRRRSMRWTNVMAILTRRHVQSEDEGVHLIHVDDDIRELLDVVHSLPRREQLLFSLHYAAGLTFEEIAEITGMKTKTAARATQRTRDRIRSRLSPPRREAI